MLVEEEILERLSKREHIRLWNSLSNEEKLEICEIFAKYKNVLDYMHEARGETHVKNQFQHFFNFCLELRPYTRLVFSETHHDLEEEYRGRVTYYFANNSIAVVVSKGVFCRFLPINALRNYEFFNEFQKLHIGQLIKGRVNLKVFYDLLGKSLGDELVPKIYYDQEKAKQIQHRKQDSYRPSPIDVSKIHITNHAIQQYIRRFKVGVGNDIRAIIFGEIARSSEDGAISAVGKVRRLIDNQFFEVRYFRHGNRRFVIRETEDGYFILLTAEEVYYK